MPSDLTDYQDELFDIVDENDKVIGQATRRDVHQNPKLIHRSIGIVIYSTDKRIFLQQRSMGKDTDQGKWTISCSGHVGSGDSYKKAAERELQEELGITVEIGEPVWRVEHQYPGRAAVLLLFFAVVSFRGRMENRIFEQIQWVQPEQLPHYDFLEADRALVQKLADRSIVPPPAGEAPTH